MQSFLFIDLIEKKSVSFSHSFVHSFRCACEIGSTCCCLVTSNQLSVGARTFPARSFPPDGTTFSQITLGQKLSKQIPPYSYWNMQFYQNEAAYVKFDYNIPRGASIGVYARRNALPTHTQYHFKEVLSGINPNPNPARVARSTHVSLPNISSLSPFKRCFGVLQPREVFRARCRGKTQSPLAAAEKILSSRPGVKIQFMCA